MKFSDFRKKNVRLNKVMNMIKVILGLGVFTFLGLTTRFSHVISIFVFTILVVLFFTFIIISIKFLPWFFNSRENRLSVFSYLGENISFIIFAAIMIATIIWTYFNLDFYEYSSSSIGALLTYSWRILALSVTAFVFTYYTNIKYLKSEKEKTINLKKLWLTKKQLNKFVHSYNATLNDKKLIIATIIFSAILLTLSTGLSFVKVWNNDINLEFFLIYSTFLICTNTFVNVVIEIWKTHRFLSLSEGLLITDEDLNMTLEEKKEKNSALYESLSPVLFEKLLKEMLKSEVEDYLASSNIKLTEEQKSKVVEEMYSKIKDNKEFQIDVATKELLESIIDLLIDTTFQ